MRRHFTQADLARITAAIAASESRHTAEVRFCVEGALELGELRAGISPRERAIEVFSELRIWDTADNNGILLYLLLADHDIEIVADRAINSCVPESEWRAICSGIEAGFRAERYTDAVIGGIERLSAILEGYFPANGTRRNDLPNDAVVRA